MGLHENLVDAAAAIQHVRELCGIRADNYDQPEFEAEGRVLQIIWLGWVFEIGLSKIDRSFVDAGK